MSNNEVRELLKTKYERDVADITYRKFKAKLNLIGNYEDELYSISDKSVTLKKNTEYNVIFTNNPEDENYVMKLYDNNGLISTVKFLKSYIFDK